jgi:hypothetical protein
MMRPLLRGKTMSESETIQTPETIYVIEKRTPLLTPRLKKIVIITASVLTVLIGAKVICSQVEQLDGDPAPEIESKDKA